VNKIDTGTRRNFNAIYFYRKRNSRDVDQLVPIGASAMLSSNIVKESTLKVYPGLPHGMCSTHKDQINADLLEFLKA
jgi:hypothetical protein